ncbi:RNA polymerase-associated protein rtf1 [Gryganskiella cystojenkinii]|nr:RNA polymerase-associated protein rtf1 [Gryganskiella cystojenkinii]
MSAADVILRLLATSKTDSNKGRRRRRSRDSSDEEISEGELSERSDDQDEDDDEDEGPVDEYDAEYYGDAKDRAELMAMNEVDREQILFERAKKRSDLLDQRQIAVRLKKAEEATRSRKGASNRDSTRRSTRAKDSKTGNTKALADLKRAQERKKARRSHSPEPRRRRRDSIDYSDKSDESSSSAEEDDAYDSEPETKKSSSSKSVARKPATLEDLNSIRMTRDKIEKWCYSPFFKDTIVGCFVRFSIGNDRNRPVYRITEVVSVGKQSKIYPVGKTMTNLTLTLKHGAAERAFTMEAISNSPFTEEEFRRFEIVLRTDKTDMVTLEHVENKKKDLEHAANYTLSNKEVEDIIELKQQMKQGRLNPIVHRTILEQQMSLQSREEAEETERRLQELKQTELNQKDLRADKLDVWAKLNERNRNLNRTSGREAEERLTKVNRAKGTEGKDVDPFARRKTVPKMVYEMSLPGTPSEAADSGKSTPAVATPPAATAVTPAQTAEAVATAPAMPQSRMEEGHEIATDATIGATASNSALSVARNSTLSQPGRAYPVLNLRHLICAGFMSNCEILMKDLIKRCPDLETLTWESSLSKLTLDAPCPKLRNLIFDDDFIGFMSDEQRGALLTRWISPLGLRSVDMSPGTVVT